MSCDPRGISKRCSTLDGPQRVISPTTPGLLSRDPRDLSARGETSRSNISPDNRDDISVEDLRLCRLIDLRLKSLLKSRDSREDEEDCLFTEQNESELGNQTSRNWSEFIDKMAASLGITNSIAPATVEERSYMASHLLPTSDPAAMELPLDGSVIRTIKEVDKDWTNKQRVHYCNSKDF